MNIGRIELSRAGRRLLVLAAALGACAATLAADKAVSADVQARYQQERAVCLNGKSNQDRDTCLREAGAALAQARHEGLGDAAAPYARNARQRCEQLPADDRTACVARMQGQGSTTGSAASGGIYRELVVRDVAPPSTVAPSTVSPGLEPEVTPVK